jgi:hypothetical protein
MTMCEKILNFCKEKNLRENIPCNQSPLPELLERKEGHSKKIEELNG